MGRVDGKVAFITGAARGQGRSHAVRLAEEGADIVAIDVCKEIPGLFSPPVTHEDLEETVRRVEAAGGRIVAREADIRDVGQLRSAVDEGVERFGRLDIIAANAGIGSSMPGPAIEMEEWVWRDMLDINLTGAWNTARAAVPAMIEVGNGGAMVMTTSAASLRAYNNIAHYTAAKHGLVGLMRTLAAELGQYGIRVTAIAPTQVATDMIMNTPTYRLLCPEIEEPTKEDFAAASGAMHMLPTAWAEPIDISNALLFLCSDEARYITATTLAVDAGVTQH